MNAYYNDFSDNRTLPVAASRRRRSSLCALIERLLCMIDALLDVLTSAKARRMALAVATTVCFFVTLGVIGGIERGLIGWGWGFTVTIILAVIEGVCIKRCK